MAQLEEVCSCYQKAIVLYSKKDSPTNKLKREDATQRLVEVCVTGGLVVFYRFDVVVTFQMPGSINHHGVLYSLIFPEYWECQLLKSLHTLSDIILLYRC